MPVAKDFGKRQLRSYFGCSEVVFMAIIGYCEDGCNVYILEDESYGGDEARTE